jgi:hypothetical protein
MEKIKINHIIVKNAAFRKAFKLDGVFIIGNPLPGKNKYRTTYTRSILKCDKGKGKK